MQGYVQVYTGNGKGKTTASIGLMLRAAGAGKKIFFGQFMKDGNYSEIKIIKERFPEITISQHGGDGLVINRDVNVNDVDGAQEGYKSAYEALVSGQYDLVVLDEINVALFLEMLTVEQVLKLIDDKPSHVELVLTGRYANPKIIEKADLVSEIMQVKHYYNAGVAARVGIEL